MKTIKLFCAMGMSTSMLVERMKTAAEKRGEDIVISAHPHAEILNHFNAMDVALLGPQIGYVLDTVKDDFMQKNVPIAVINMSDYGLMDGEKVLDFALSLVEN